MYILLILFFLSMSGLVFMIGRKLMLIRNGTIIHREHFRVFIPDIQTIKYAIYKNTKKGGYVLLVLTVRFYVKSGSFLKYGYEQIKTKIKNLSDELQGCNY